MKKLRVGILFGGRSGEPEVSLQWAASVFNAIDKEALRDHGCANVKIEVIKNSVHYVADESTRGRGSTHRTVRHLLNLHYKDY